MNSTTKNLPDIVLSWMIANVVLIIVISLFLGYRFYRSLQPVAYGIERLSRQEQNSLPEKGMTEKMAQRQSFQEKQLMSWDCAW